MLGGSACTENTRSETSRRLSTIEDLITVKRWPTLKQSDPLKLVTYLYLDYVKFKNQQIVCPVPYRVSPELETNNLGEYCIFLINSHWSEIQYNSSLKQDLLQ